MTVKNGVSSGGSVMSIAGQILYRKAAKTAPAPKRAPEATLTAAAAPVELEEAAEPEAEAVPEADEEPEAEEPDSEAEAEEPEPEADEPVSEAEAEAPVPVAEMMRLPEEVPTMVASPPTMEVTVLSAETTMSVLLPMAMVYRPLPRAGMVATWGCEVATAGWLGMPVMTPSELVMVRKDVRPLEYETLLALAALAAELTAEVAAEAAL